jgi:hypothetical protein
MKLGPVRLGFSTAWWACTRPALTVGLLPQSDYDGPTKVIVSVGLTNHHSDPVVELEAEVTVPFAWTEAWWRSP